MDKKDFKYFAQVKIEGKDLKWLKTNNKRIAQKWMNELVKEYDFLQVECELQDKDCSVLVNKTWLPQEGRYSYGQTD